MVKVLKFEHFILYFFWGGGGGGGAEILFSMCLFHKTSGGIVNSEDQNQPAPSGAVWSGSILFAQAILWERLMYEI